MKKFKFRYESVLKMRMDAEDKVKHQLAGLIKERQNQLDALEALKGREQSYLVFIEESLRSGRAKHEMHHFSDGKKYYSDHKHVLQNRVSRLDQDIKKKQEELLEAVKSRKIMEKLKENAYRAYVEAFNEADAKLIEEVVNYKNNRTNGES
ncbi:flagellar export protein FliJ [Fusibacter tunisiensis]|uniref:Flagellar FliJ protein n=1 Tax=Fusibacter tunisiensis TaxID=1008308 RepID=A0ABS2MMH8_9FIRM|nr:flagellar export protein FliJ [Fusibacter tunisiensis]MBM7560584.1 flagellar FliJ protein [Fusibacter tunisiensis]